MNWPGVGIQRIPPAPVLLITPRARWEGWQGDFHQPQLLGLPYGGYPMGVTLGSCGRRGLEGVEPKSPKPVECGTLINQVKKKKSLMFKQNP